MPRSVPARNLLSTGMSVLAAVLCLATAPVSAQTAGAPPSGPATDSSGTSGAPLPTMAEVERAWQRGDYVAVREGLALLATETGTALAQYRYGRVLAEGRGGPRDPVAAADWLQKAVDQEHVEAATLLARLYLTGDESGIPRDPARAAALLSAAAARGNAEAQYYLGLLHRAGDGVEKNPETSFNWLRAAAEQHHVEAQYELARAYSRGSGTAENPEKSLHWLNEAATNGHREAQFFLGNAYETGKGAPANPAEALRWFRRAAEAGHPLAQRILGTKYLQGDGVDPDADEALRWLESAAAAGEPGAMSNLGYAYAKGKGVPRDDARAVYWYEQAAEAGVGRAMLALGVFYEAGRGTEPSIERAVALYRQAVAQDTPGAAERLGRLALAGDLDGLAAPHEAVAWVAVLAAAGETAAVDWLEARAGEGMRQAGLALGLHHLAQDGGAARAVPFLARAAEAGDSRAQYELGRLHTTGDGVELDYVTGHMWLNIAAAGGMTQAAKDRDLIATLMTPEQVAEAQAAARAHFESAKSRTPQTEQTVREGQ